MVAAFASPHVGSLGIVAVLSLAATSVARLVAGRGVAALRPADSFTAERAA